MKISRIFVTVDVVLVKGDKLLLIKRKKEPFQNCWALPGGFVEEHEDLEEAAKRELLEETSINIKTLKQVGAFGTPHRDPRHHSVSVAFCAKVAENTMAIAADDAKEAEWFYLNNLPDLAFDHAQIIKKTLIII